MRDHYLAAAAMTLIVLCGTTYSAAKDNPATQLQIEPSPGSPAKTPGAPPRELIVTVLDNGEVFKGPWALVPETPSAN